MLNVTKSASPDTTVEAISVAKADVVKAWTLLERLVVSLDRIGSYYAVPFGQEVPPERQRAMEHEVAEVVDFAELAEARRCLDRWLDDHEAEAISDSLRYWTAPLDRKSAADGPQSSCKE